jgi:hypothetical protein
MSSLSSQFASAPSTSGTPFDLGAQIRWQVQFATCSRSGAGRVMGTWLAGRLRSARPWHITRQEPAQISGAADTRPSPSPGDAASSARGCRPTLHGRAAPAG